MRASISAILIVAFLTACGGAANNSSTANNAAPAKAPEKTESKPAVTLKPGEVPFEGMSNLATTAKAGEVVLTDATADAAGLIEDVELERLGGRQLKNVLEPVELLRASRMGAHEGATRIDPVCRMSLADGAWIGSLCFAGRRYYFCSMDCARKFTAEPERYVSR
ncbi:MAG TPA: YHS domain-containing protein [Pyrinomonadaceae bacterium]|nr:YHS domain-containing protein [Pyrinomonadaceae bacterium]